MASLFDVVHSSDSEEDCDYEPPPDKLSSEEEEPISCSDDENGNMRKSRKQQRNSVRFLKAESKRIEINNQASSDQNTADEKKIADDVYKNFLDEVAAEMRDVKNESLSSGISCSESTTSSPIAPNTDKNSCHSSTANSPEKLIEFTKETVPVKQNSFFSLSSNSPCISGSELKESVPSAVTSAPMTVKRKGLDSVLGNILNKKQKMTTLTKSMLDWKVFKAEEGIEEELASFNRGKGGYIERKRFLERSDVRSFEIERDIRLTKRQTKRDV